MGIGITSQGVTMVSTHYKRVNDCFEEWVDKEHDVILISSDGDHIGLHKIALGMFSHFLPNVIMHADTVNHISVPASSTVLKHLVTIITTGITIANDKDELKQVSEIADVLGISFSDWQIGVGRKKRKAEAIDMSPKKMKEIVKEENIDASSQLPCDDGEVDECESNSEECEDDGNEEEVTDETSIGVDLECYVYKCQETFKLRSDLRKHIEEYHPTKLERKESEYTNSETKQFQCYFCDKWFKTKKYRGHHIRIFHRDLAKIERKVPCKICQKAHGFNLQDDKHYTCEICQQMFYGSKMLGKHKTIKHGLRKRALKIAIPYVPGDPNHCHTCETAFRSQSELIIHEDTKHVKEHGSNFYTCRFCDRKMKIRQHNAIVEHLRKHTGERPEICTFCGMTFKQKKALQNHERLHTGVKPYKCEYCFSAFTQRFALTSHQKSRNGCQTN